MYILYFFTSTFHIHISIVPNLPAIAKCNLKSWSKHWCLYGWMLYGYFQVAILYVHMFSLTSFLLPPKLFSMIMVSAAMWQYLEQGGKGRLAIAITPTRTSTTLPPEYRQTSARLRTSCSCSDRDGILHTQVNTQCQ